MESEVFQSGVLQELLVEVYHRVRVVHLSGEGRGEHVGAVRVLGVLLDQQVHRSLGNVIRLPPEFHQTLSFL